MIYAILQAICQFARVSHVRDLICAYACKVHALWAFSYALRKPAVRPAGPGPAALVPARHERMPARLERTRGAAVGGVKPPSSNHHRESEANGVFPLVSRALAHATSARIAHALGHSTYLMITVPVDTILVIRDLQIFFKKKWCQIMLFSRKGFLL